MATVKRIASINNQEQALSALKNTEDYNAGINTMRELYSYNAALIWRCWNILKFSFSLDFYNAIAIFKIRFIQLISFSLHRNKEISYTDK